MILNLLLVYLLVPSYGRAEDVVGDGQSDKNVHDVETSSTEDEFESIFSSFETTPKVEEAEETTTPKDLFEEAIEGVTEKVLATTIDTFVTDAMTTSTDATTQKMVIVTEEDEYYDDDDEYYDDEEITETPTSRTPTTGEPTTVLVTIDTNDGVLHQVIDGEWPPPDWKNGIDGKQKEEPFKGNGDEEEASTEVFEAEDVSIEETDDEEEKDNLKIIFENEESEASENLIRELFEELKIQILMETEKILLNEAFDVLNENFDEEMRIPDAEGDANENIDDIEEIADDGADGIDNLPMDKESLDDESASNGNQIIDVKDNGANEKISDAIYSTDMMIDATTTNDPMDTSTGSEMTTTEVATEAVEEPNGGAKNRGPAGPTDNGVGDDGNDVGKLDIEDAIRNDPDMEMVTEKFVASDGNDAYQMSAQQSDDPKTESWSSQQELNGKDGNEGERVLLESFGREGGKDDQKIEGGDEKEEMEKKERKEIEEKKKKNEKKKKEVVTPKPAPKKKSKEKARQPSATTQKPGTTSSKPRKVKIRSPPVTTPIAPGSTMPPTSAPKPRKAKVRLLTTTSPPTPTTPTPTKPSKPRKVKIIPLRTTLPPTSEPTTISPATSKPRRKRTRPSPATSPPTDLASLTTAPPRKKRLRSPSSSPGISTPPPPATTPAPRKMRLKSHANTTPPTEQLPPTKRKRKSTPQTAATTAPPTIVITDKKD